MKEREKEGGEWMFEIIKRGSEKGKTKKLCIIFRNMKSVKVCAVILHKEYANQNHIEYQIPCIKNALFV